MRSFVSHPPKNSNLQQLTWYLLCLFLPCWMKRPMVICLVVFMNLHATADTFPVRLVGGPNLCVGRVELFHQNKWGTVCDDDWDMRDAVVVCREMNCGEALSAPHGAWFGEGTGPIWLNEVRCVGSEWYLHTCHHLGFRRHVCTHEEDASVICSEQRFPPLTAAPPESTIRRNQPQAVTETGPHLSPTPAEGSPILRLVGGQTHCSGRLEIFHDGQWGTVCDDMWDLLDVAVVCRELDCGEALAAPGGAFFGEGNNIIWLDDVQCQGQELTLTQCHTSSWGTNNCRHSEDAGVVCSGEMSLAMVEENIATLTRTLAPQTQRTPAPKRILRPPRPTRRQKETAANEVSHREKNAKEHVSEAILNGQWQLRLVGGPGNCAGRVEVFYKKRWGTVCDDGWDMVDAAVVCRELVCGAPLLSPGNARYGPGSGPIWLDDVNCTGSEFTLRRCRSKPWGKHNCNHHEDASVICTGKWKRLSLLKPSNNSNTAQSTTITSTTEGVTPTVEPRLHTTLHAPETTTATQDFSVEWEMELLYATSSNKPSITTQNVELEQEKNSTPINPMNTIKTPLNPEIQQLINEMESAINQNTRSTTHTWIQSPIYPTVEFHSSSIVQEQVSERKADITTQRVINKTMFNPEVTQGVQEVESSSSPMTRTLPQWKPKPTSSSDIFQHHLNMENMKSEKETETTRSLGTEYFTTTTPEILVSTRRSGTTEYAHKWEQELTHSSVKYQPSSTGQDLESKRLIETTTYKDMGKTMPDLENLASVQNIEQTSSVKTWTAAHGWWGKVTSSSTEFLSPLNMDGQDFERKHETTSPSGTECSIATEGRKSVTEVVSSVYWDKTSEEPLVTQNTEPINSSTEAQPTIARWAQEPEGELETIGYLSKKLALSSDTLEVKVEMDLPTTTENEQSIHPLEAVTPQTQNSEENTSQQQQEGLRRYLQTVKSTASASLLKTLSTRNGTDIHSTTDLPQSPVSHTVGKILQNGLVRSGYTENGMSYPCATSASDLTEATGPNLRSAEAVTHHSKPSEASSGYPEESRREDQACSCSSPALGSLAHSMEGLSRELGSLSTAIQHQGSKIEAVAHSLAELATSVHLLVKVLPALVQQAPAQHCSTSPKQNKDPLQNQLPLK